MPGINESISKLFVTAVESVKPEEAEIKGTLPTWVAGLYLRVGPGKFDFPNNFTVNHWLDGYAILSKFKIANNSVIFEKKYLQSDAYKKAIAAQKPVINEFATRGIPDPNKGFFSRVWSSLIPEFSDNDYSTLFKLGPELYVTCDSCFFRKVDQTSLSTGEKCDGNKYFGLNGQCAHPLTDEKGDSWIIGFTIVGLKYHVIKVPGSNSSKDMLKNAKTIASIPSRWSGCIGNMHSFGMTQNYIILVEQPFVMSVTKVAASILKDETFKDWLEWKPQEKNRFYIIEKATGKVLKTELVSADAFHYLHFVNCYEEDSQIVMDIVTYESTNVLDSLYLSKLRNNVEEVYDFACVQRYIVPIISNLKDSKEGVNLVSFPNTKCTAVRKGNQIILSPDSITKRGLEMPMINKKFMGRKYSYAYGGGTFSPTYFSNSICKVDLNKKETIIWKENEFLHPGEPMFVPNPDGVAEDDGVLIVPVLDDRDGYEDYIIFLDAKDLKEIGRAKFKSAIPSALHGIFLSE